MSGEAGSTSSSCRWTWLGSTCATNCGGESTVIENAYLAAKSQLEEVRQDVKENVGSARERAQQLLHDLRQVYDAAEAVVRRGRGT